MATWRQIMDAGAPGVYESVLQRTGSRGDALAHIRSRFAFDSEKDYREVVNRLTAAEGAADDYNRKRGDPTVKVAGLPYHQGSGTTREATGCQVIVVASPQWTEEDGSVRWDVPITMRFDHPPTRSEIENEIRAASIDDGGSGEPTLPGELRAITVFSGFKVHQIYRCY